MSQNQGVNQVALVTGAAQGMGKSIAATLADSGMTVYLADLNAEKIEASAKEISGIPLAVDVTDEGQVKTLFEKIDIEQQRLDVLVNNAGILRSTRFGQISKSEWDLVLDVNLNGTFLCTQAAVEIMARRGHGRIVNMSSSAGRSVSTLGGAHYTAAKAAVLGFTRAVAKETAEQGITCNAVCPGLINTDMVQQNCSEEKVNAYEDSFPISRLGTPQEVADLVAFLIDKGSYITGASIDINGGDLMI